MMCPNRRHVILNTAVSTCSVRPCTRLEYGYACGYAYSRMDKSSTHKLAPPQERRTNLPCALAALLVAHPLPQEAAGNGDLIRLIGAARSKLCSPRS